MDIFTGEIIEESLQNRAILKKLKILSKRVEKVTEKHKTPWLKKWTLDKIAVKASEAAELAETLSHSLDNKHNGSWYVDFKNKTHHYIIFPNKIFLIDRSDKTQYEEATRFGIKLGIPSYQVDFNPLIKS